MVTNALSDVLIAKQKKQYHCEILIILAAVCISVLNSQKNVQIKLNSYGLVVMYHKVIKLINL